MNWFTLGVALVSASKDPADQEATLAALAALAGLGLILAWLLLT